MACAVLGFVGLLNMALRVSFFIIGVQEAEWHPKIHRLFVFGSFSFSIGPSGEKVWVNHLYPESMIQTKNTVFTLVHSLKLIFSPMLHTYTKFHGSQACSFSVILLWKKLNTANQNLMFIFNGLNRLNAYMKITHKQTSNITRERANLYYSAYNNPQLHGLNGRLKGTFQLIFARPLGSRPLLATKTNSSKNPLTAIPNKVVHLADTLLWQRWRPKTEQIQREYWMWCHHEARNLVNPCYSGNMEYKKEPVSSFMSSFMSQ